MKVVNASGAVQTTGFDWGCSHSGYERVTWDPTARKFVAVCKNDAPTGGVGAPGVRARLHRSPADLNYNQLGTVMIAGRRLPAAETHPRGAAGQRERAG